jgi:hypothetical protein
MSLLTGISVKCKLFPLSISQEVLLIQSQVKSCLVAVVQNDLKKSIIMYCSYYNYELLDSLIVGRAFNG